MALSDANADKLVNRIDRLVGAMDAQKGSAESFARIDETLKWYKRVGYFSVTGLLFLFGWVFLRVPSTADVQNAVNTGLNPVNDKLSTLSQNLAVLTATVELLTPDASKNLGKIMKQSLRKNGDSELGLKTFAALATTAQQRRITTDPNSLKDVGDDLLSLKDRDVDFWKASAALINYRSFNSLPKHAVVLSNVNLPTCTAKDPAPMTVMEVGPAGELKKISNAYYENCRFTIDSPQDDERISLLVRTHYLT